MSTQPPTLNRQQRRHGADRFETAAELADRWGVSRQHVYSMLHKGLPSVTIGRSRRFRPTEVDAWIEARR